jgi:hypothetical protein
MFLPHTPVIIRKLIIEFKLEIEFKQFICCDLGTGED